MTNSSGQSASPSSHCALPVLVFKVLMWLNGLGVAAILAVALGFTDSALSPHWLRLPMALFLAGMMLTMLGLFWTGVLQTALTRQRLSGYVRRSHWVPALFTTISYGCALLVFAAACWAFLGVATLSRIYDDVHQGAGQHHVPRFQHP